MVNHSKDNIIKLKMKSDLFNILNFSHKSIVTFKKDKLAPSDIEKPESNAAAGAETINDEQKLKNEIEILKSKDEELNNEILKLKNEGYSTDKLSEFIDKLHEYNDLKDAGLIIFGQLATLENLPIKALYEKYGLNLDD
uniref:DNA repair protein SWI5 homolog n=1 Tax=Romanomermis culicivorax TaxID=13658 RepID=A0A915HFB9_ROMCU